MQGNSDPHDVAVQCPDAANPWNCHAASDTQCPNHHGYSAECDVKLIILADSKMAVVASKKDASVVTLLKGIQVQANAVPRTECATCIVLGKNKSLTSATICTTATSRQDSTRGFPTFVGSLLCSCFKACHLKVFLNLSKTSDRHPSSHVLVPKHARAHKRTDRQSDRQTHTQHAKTRLHKQDTSSHPHANAPTLTHTHTHTPMPD